MFTLTRVGEPMIQIQGIPQATKHETSETTVNRLQSLFHDVTGLPTKDETSETTVRNLFICSYIPLFPMDLNRWLSLSNNLIRI